MRQYVETCLRAMTGFQGKFSEEMERYWRDVQTRYSACNVPMMPQDHIPIWWARAQDEKVSLEEKPKVEPKGTSRRESVGV